MKKNQFKAIYGISVEKSETVSEYILQQKLLRRLRKEITTIQEKYGAKWQETWGNIEDRVLIMQKQELEESGMILDKKGIIAFKSEIQNIINRNRYSNFATYKKKENKFLKPVKF